MVKDTKRIQVNKVPNPAVNDIELLVKIFSASLCHSGMMLLEGSFPGADVPVTMGHEGVGIVDSVGESVKGFIPGDKVGFLFFKDCCCKYFRAQSP